MEGGNGVTQEKVDAVGRKLDQLIGMQQAKAKERAGPRWAFVDEKAPGAPPLLDSAFYCERATDKVWHRAVDAPVPEGCVACFASSPWRESST